jgi:hypothetical protein
LAVSANVALFQVVSEYSAVMGLPNELVIPVNANHRNICRYSTKQSQTYILVEAAIQELMGVVSISRVLSQSESRQSDINLVLHVTNEEFLSQLKLVTE